MPLRVVYADVVFVLNFLLDALSLWCTAQLSGIGVRRCRWLFASGFGALYSVFTLYFTWGKGLFPWAAAAGMTALCFGMDALFLRRLLLFLVVSCVLSGAATAVQYTLLRTDSVWLVFLIAAVFCYVALSVIFHGGVREDAVKLRATITHRGKSVRLMLLRDTGNSLRDSATGQTVCVVWRGVISPLLRDERYFTLPYRSLGAEAGELACFYCDAITVEGVTYRHYPIGLADHPLTDGSGFAGLWGGEWKGEGKHAEKSEGKTA